MVFHFELDIDGDVEGQKRRRKMFVCWKGKKGEVSQAEDFVPPGWGEVRKEAQRVVRFRKQLQC